MHSLTCQPAESLIVLSVGPSISASPCRACVARPDRIGTSLLLLLRAIALALRGDLIYYWPAPHAGPALYFTFAGFGPFIIFVAGAGRTGAATDATARP